MSTLRELAERRKNQSDLASSIAATVDLMKGLTDENIRTYNLLCKNGSSSAENMEINDVTVSDIYLFAYQLYNETERNLLNVNLSDETDRTLLWSLGGLVRLINDRKLTEEQYNCLGNAAEVYKASDGDVAIAENLLAENIHSS